ncbi:MAG TPA: condensation domain-containing protein, partial [Spongiibacteraceae bacterium]|nr:condensation domain-containing protein [Spongiibacteraceae bacterium]
MPIEARDPATPAPASSQQMRLWYLGQIETDYNANNLPAAFRLTGPLDLDALQQAMDRIVQRQAALRTNIVMQDGELVQVVRENLRLDLSPVPAADFGVEAGHAQTVDALALAIKRECAIPFDLATDPLIRAGLVQLAADDHVLYVIIHHVIFDGWSFDVLLHELFTLYNAYRAGRPDPLPALPVSYADYAAWQRRWLASAPVQAQLDYWLEHLAGELPILDLPLDRPRPPLQHHTADAVLIDIDGPLLARLDAVANRCGATLFMVMLSLYAATLFRYTRQSDLLIGAPISGRNMDELSGLLGFFVNTLVFRLEVDSDQPYAQWLQAVKRECLQAYDHQDTPFELIIQHLKLPRDLSRSPVYQTLFIYQDVRNRTDQPDGMHKEQVNIELAGVQTDLDFWLKRETGHMSGGFEFPVALFERDTIAAMAASFMAMARRLADNPEQRIAELVAPTDDERARLSAWNATGSDYPRDRGLAAVLGE